jgi:hypothetical protein
MNLGAPRRRGVAHGGSHQLSLPPIQLSQVVRPASRFKPAAQHISNPSSHPSISPIDCAHSSSIHPLTSRSVDQSINRSRNQTIYYCLRHVTDVVSSRRLAINQSIDRSISPINQSSLTHSLTHTHSLNPSSVEPPARCNQSIDQSVRSPSA